MGRNILYKTNEALLNKTFTDGLLYYTQANCQVTLTDIGYHIYRPPNKTPSTDGSTMWGGLVIRPFNADANALIKGHRYVIKFEVKGKSSNGVSSEMNWSNQCGWGGGGLSPTPSNVVYNGLPANFNSEDWYPIQYAWTINDDIIKTCTTSYSSFVAGQQYISYRDFKFGYGYVDTGDLGTDIYLRNIRLYDITTPQNIINVNKQGIVNSGNLVENKGNVSFKIDSDLYATEFIEI